ncbi:MAG: sulfide/dihydroorotate dehydrogenase-like FAD/NAD-binding protein [Elusimicrobiota bacterium]
MKKNNIISILPLAEKIKQIEVFSPEIARKIQPGQFVIIRVHKNGERIPLTVAKKTPATGILTIVFQEVGVTTTLLGRLKPGDALHDIAGPLGKAAEIMYYGNVVVVAGGVGAAEVLPVCGALKSKGNTVDVIVGARSASMLILLDDFKKAGDRLFIATDDGTAGDKGFVTDVLKKLVTAPGSGGISLVYSAGPVLMMKRVCEIAKEAGIRTVVSLNPIMIDGTGMCGSCRVTVSGKMKFACVDGPEFDGDDINWDELENRVKLFSGQEREAIKKLNDKK